MIDERIEVMHYINGENIYKQNIYRMCYLMTKYYRDEGLSAFETRQKIFQWANDNHLFIKCNVNDLINIVYMRDLDPLLTGKEIYVSKEDIKNINDRFDAKGPRIVSLALLCLAKAFENKNKEFQCSGIAVASWTGISKSCFFYSIKEISLMGYVSQLDTTKSHLHRWQDRPLIQINGNTYKILCDHTNDGEYKLENNDIVDLYHKCYSV